MNAEQVGYKQSLGRRHVQMIAIGGAIGTGLFLGSASRLHNTGPALLLSYAFVGVIAYFLMRALGELVLHRATSGAFVSYMREFFGEPAAFVTPAPVAGAPGGKLTIGIAFDQPGLGMRTGDAYTGFDVDTAIYIAGALGVTRDNITWKEANSDQRQQLLESGGADLIVSTFSITDQRKQVVDFAGPYFVAHQDLLVRRNDTETTGPDRLDGKNLCSVPGTTSAAYVTSHFLGNIKLTEKPRFSDCVTALANSEVDAVTTDDVILAGFAAQPQYQGKLKVVGKGFSDEIYGVGVKKGNASLVDKVNAALKQYIDDGSWRKSLDANVRPSGYSIPSPPTVAD